MKRKVFEGITHISCVDIATTMEQDGKHSGIRLPQCDPRRPASTKKVGLFTEWQRDYTKLVMEPPLKPPRRESTDKGDDVGFDIPDQAGHRRSGDPDQIFLIFKGLPSQSSVLSFQCLSRTSFNSTFFVSGP